MARRPARGTAACVQLFHKTPWENTMARLIEEHFDSFAASGFAPTPATGQLDSDVWRVSGFSDGTTTYGGTFTTGDFARGVITTGDPTTAGVYAADVTGDGRAFVVQPTGAEFDINGFIEARITNTTGAAVSDFTINFDWAYRNNADRAENMTFSYSTDGTNFTNVPAAAFSTPQGLV